MAQVTEAALDDRELRRLRQPKPGLPPPPIGRALAPVGSIASLALLVVGAGTILAPDGLPRPVVLAAIVAVALAGWLARGPSVADDRNAATVNRERGELIRAALALGLRGHDAVVEIARRAGAGTAGVEPGDPPSDDRPTGQPIALRDRPIVLRATDESLEPDADAGTGGL